MQSGMGKNQKNSENLSRPHLFNRILRVTAFPANFFCSIFFFLNGSLCNLTSSSTLFSLTSCYCFGLSMADWRKLFAPTSNHFLDFFPPESLDGVPNVSPPTHVFDEGIEDWKFAVVAQFLDSPPNFTILLRTLKKLWDKKGTFTVNSVGSNTFIINFESDEICSWIIDNGPWHVLNIPMILRRWEPNMNKIDFEPNKLPLWFHLHQIPLELYNQKGISYIASAIRQPLYMDSVTASKKRLSYAKVCIEANAAIEPPDAINIRRKDGTITSISVSIPWKPKICHACVAFGHNDKNCTKNHSKKENTDVISYTMIKQDTLLDEQTSNMGKEEVENVESPKTIAPKNVEKEKRICSPSKSSQIKSNTKNVITSSSNKYLALCDNSLFEDEDNLDEGDSSNGSEHNKNEEMEGQWQHLIDNAKITCNDPDFWTQKF